MPEPDEGSTDTGAQLAAVTQELEQIKGQLAERGFDSVAALLADRDTVAEERDHFKEHNEKAQKIIQRQGSELGQLRQGKPPKPDKD